MVKNRKIAIIGSASPVIDNMTALKMKGWEFWSMNNLFIRFLDVPFTRWFELHHFTRKGSCYLRRGQTEYGGYPTIKAYLEAMNNLDIPVYMQRPLAPVKKAVRFPFIDIMRYFKTQYFGCSFAWMVALILYEHLHGKRVGTIAFLGTELSTCEYYFQRPSTEHWIGRAQGMGIEVIISNTSNLLKAPWIYAYRENFDCVDMLYVSVAKELLTIASIPMQRLFEAAYYQNDISVPSLWPSDEVL